MRVIMNLEKHILDTMKEWQLKMGSIGSDIRLYYPKGSMCRYMNVESDIENNELIKRIVQYLELSMPYMAKVTIAEQNDRFCIHISKEGCEYVENNVQMPDFLEGMLEVLKSQDMDSMIAYFAEYAIGHGTKLCKEKDEDDGGIILYFEDEIVEPYVYCIDENDFGITYHRFTREEYQEFYP